MAMEEVNSMHHMMSNITVLGACIYVAELDNERVQVYNGCQWSLLTSINLVRKGWEN